MASEEAAAAAKLERFLQWLQVNKAELRGCNIKYCDQNKGFGVFSSNDVSDGVLLVVPLDLAITPMRVLQDPLIGPECRAMFEEGEVDDRFLMILFLMLERLRNNSSWKPYLDMLPTTFGNPLWFTDDELLELKGTTLYRATELQRKRLLSLYEDKAKGLVQKLLILDGDLEIEVCFEDFLWANSVFWTRALNIPLPRIPRFAGVDGQSNETVWVEGLVPGIDFCNHNLKAVATWEVDGTGMAIGVPQSMYLLSAEKTPFQMEKEITISYGNKGNEELLYLYGFVIDNNPDEYLMVHYPVEAIQNVPFADSKMQLLEAQKAEMRCLLPKRLLAHGFFPEGATSNDNNSKGKAEKICSFSWSGQRRMPSYINKLVFPEEFLTALRTIAMQEDELFKVTSFLEELVGSEGVRQPTDTEVKTAVWEACGDSGALQLLFDLLQTK
ncbi:putative METHYLTRANSFERASE [Salix viminalis]|uniref:METHYLTRANSFERASE n=1 Tax=Salix viminalis TaxID=40686 RepID=A0A9Q0NT73_SALVM|nr:putative METHYLTRANSFERASE [Salix viminalis]